MRKNISSKTGEAKSIRVLIVEDSEDDVLLMIRQLKKGGYNPVYERVETAAAMLSALQDKTWDIVLTDYKMPRFSGTKAIALLQETNIDLPLIIVSGTIGEDTAVECMRLGAQDFIMKGNMSRLVPAIKREIAEAKSRAERKLAEQAVIASEVRFRELFENMISCVAVYGAVADGTDFVLKDFNRAAEIAEKIDRQKIIGQSLLKVFPGAREMGLLAVLQRVWRTGRSEHVPAAYYKDARNEGWRENYVYKLPTGEVVALYSDITERIKAERKILENEAKYRLLADNVGDVIFVLDMNLKYTYISPSVKNLREYEPEEVLKQQSIEQTLTPSSQALAMTTFSEIMELEKSGKREMPQSQILQLEMIRKDGTTVWTEVKLSFIRDENQQPVGIMGLTRDITERMQTERELYQTLDNLRKSFGATVQVMVSAVEMRDPYTAGHQLRVADLARTIATEMGLPQDKIEGIRMAGSIHDIGKLSIPAEILSRPTKLTNIEFSMIKEHPQSGYEMLKNVDSPWPLAQIVYQHHERMNGTGYPRNLKGNEILMEARIMAVADVVEAMASHRPYRAALGIEAALEEIEKNKGIIYDADVVDACLKLFREKGYQLK